MLIIKTNEMDSLKQIFEPQLTPTQSWSEDAIIRFPRDLFDIVSEEACYNVSDKLQESIKNTNNPILYCCSQEHSQIKGN